PTRTPAPATPTATITRTPSPSATTPAAPREMRVSAGANLITWPYAAASAADVARRTGGAVEVVYAFDGASRTWRLYGPALHVQGNSLTMLLPGQAYW